MSPTRLTGLVHVFKDNEVVTLNPGDILPDWAVDKVTNPDVLEEFDADAPPAQPAEPDHGAPADVPPSAQTPDDIKNLRDQAKELGVDARGNAETLRTRINAKREEIAVAEAEEAAKTGENEPAGDENPGGDASDDAPAGIDALRAKAKELGIDDITDETTEVELEVLIASKE